MCFLPYSIYIYFLVQICIQDTMSLYIYIFESFFFLTIIVLSYFFILFFFFSLGTESGKILVFRIPSKGTDVTLQSTLKGWYY